MPPVVLMSRATDSRRAWPTYALLLFIAGAHLLPLVIPEHEVPGTARSLMTDDTVWFASSGQPWDFTTKGAPGFYSTYIPVRAKADFLSVDMCYGRSESSQGRAASSRDGKTLTEELNLEVMLASVAAGHLDFSRHYGAELPLETQGLTCVVELFPRRAHDDGAVLQLRVASPDLYIEVHQLLVNEVIIRSQWTMTAYLIIALGVTLFAVRLYAYKKLVPTLLLLTGLSLVAAIFLGCLLSVGAKADIYALLFASPWDATLPQASQAAALDITALLREPFPPGAFAFFSWMHFLLFAGAALFLSSVYRYASSDLALLAVLTETLQIYVPGRGPGVDDVLIDVAGVAAGATLLFALRRSQRVRLFLKH